RFRGRWLFADREFSSERRQFLQTAENEVRFFLVLPRVDKARVGNRGYPHLCRLRRGDAGERVLNHKARVSRYSKVLRRAQVDVGRGFAVFNFFASNNDFEESGQLMSI